MLLPALSRAREQANSAKCLSNMRQLAMATIGYTNFNKGMFPSQGAAGMTRPDWIAWGDNTLELDPAQTVYIDNGVLQPYMGAKGEVLRTAFRCPSDDVETRPAPSDLSKPRYKYSYSMNQMLTRPDQFRNPPYSYQGPSGKNLRIQQVRNSSVKLLLIEEDTATIDDGIWKAFILDVTQNPPVFYNHLTPFDPASASSVVNQVADRHERKKDKYNPMGRGNVAFCDGHAEFFSRADVGKIVHHCPWAQ